MHELLSDEVYNTIEGFCDYVKVLCWMQWDIDGGGREFTKLPRPLKEVQSER